MAYRYRSPDGHYLEADSAQDLRELLQVIGIQLVQSSPPVSVLGGKQPAGDDESTTERLWRFFERLRSEDQKAVLMTLARFDDWLSDDLLRAHIGMSKKPALGGVMAALVKNSSAVGVKFYKQVLNKQPKRGSDGRYFNRYRLTTEMRNLLREKLGIPRSPQMFETTTPNGVVVSHIEPVLSGQ